MNDPSCEWAAFTTGQCQCRVCQLYRLNRLIARYKKKPKEQSE